MGWECTRSKTMFFCARMMLVCCWLTKNSQLVWGPYVTHRIQSQARGPGLHWEDWAHLLSNHTLNIKIWSCSQFEILIQGEERYVQVVICNRSGRGLCVKKNSRLSGETANQGVCRCTFSFQEENVVQHVRWSGKPAKAVYSVAGHRNPRPKFPLLVLCHA